MHPQRKSQGKRSAGTGAEVTVGAEQQEVLLRSLEADVEKLLLELVDVRAQALRVFDLGYGADSADLEQAGSELERMAELRRWARATRADVAARLQALGQAPLPFS